MAEDWLAEDAERRADLAEAMVGPAAALVEAVHDQDATEVRRILGLIAPENLPALAVVLAGMVSPDATMVQLLGWVPIVPRGVEEWELAERYKVDLPLPSDRREWSAETLRACHAAYTAGHRRFWWVVDGHREWDRRRAEHRRRRASG